MQSTKAFPDRSRTQSPPSKDLTSQSELDSTPDPKSLHKNETGVQAQAQAETEAEGDSGWQPRFDRRQSWSNQDRKHYLQERLLNVEGSRERGFTEVNRGC